MKLHIQTLIDKGACSNQVELFRAMFGESVNVTQELCVSVADKFDFEWTALQLLTPTAQAEYERVRAQAWAEYERVEAPVRAKYERVEAPARAEYERVRASAWAEKERVMASTFAELYNAEVQS